MSKRRLLQAPLPVVHRQPHALGIVRSGWLLLLGLLLIGCGRPDPGPLAVAQVADTIPLAATVGPAAAPPIAATPSTAVVASPTATLPDVGVASPAASTSNEAASSACGQLLPAVPLPEAEAAVLLPANTAARSQLEAQVPTAARVALERLLAEPQSVGLAAYQMGQEAQGVFLNADIAMPLASVVKVIHLVAYVEAVAAGELNPLEPVPLAALETYYLPGSDLGAHRRAIEELEDNGRVFNAVDPFVPLEEVPWMMIRHSSNAATDYLHHRLGQRRIEETALQLGLTRQTAPCPFLGQFLLIANHVRGAGNDLAVLLQYLTPALGLDYGRDVASLAASFQDDVVFRQQEIAWRDGRRPALEAQRFFSEQLNARGSAREYAALMLRLAQNGLTHPDSSYHARRYLEWPMRFPVNQELFSNLGYKGGSLPGVLTGVYYAYRPGEVVPVVVALFYRDLPQTLYRQWRADFPHDELARWLLADPEAIALLRQAIGGG